MCVCVCIHDPYEGSGFERRLAVSLDWYPASFHGHVRTILFRRLDLIFRVCGMATAADVPPTVWVPSAATSAPFLFGFWGVGSWGVKFGVKTWG